MDLKEDIRVLEKDTLIAELGPQLPSGLLFYVTSLGT